MSKVGWWKVNFDIVVDGVEVDIRELSEKQRQHIFDLVQKGCVAGEVIPEEKEEKHEARTREKFVYRWPAQPV